MTTIALGLFPAPPKPTDIDLSRPQLNKVTRTQEELKALSQRLGSSSAPESLPKTSRKDVPAATERSSMDIARPARTATPPGHHSSNTSISQTTSTARFAVQQTPTTRVVPGRRSMDTERNIRPQLHVRKRSSTSDLKTVTENVAQTFTSPQRQQTAPALTLKTSTRSRTPVSATSSVYSQRTTSSILASPAADTPATSNMASPLSIRRRQSSKGSVIVQTPLSIRSANTLSFSADEDFKAHHRAISTPTKAAFTIAVTTNPAFPPRSQSLRTNARTLSLTQDNADKAATKPLPGPPPPAQSIFPTYDTNKSLSQQSYFPLRVAIPPSRSKRAPIIVDISEERKAAMKQDNSPPRISVLRKDSGIDVPSGEPEEILPDIEFDDLNSLWMASTRLGACGGRKVRLGLRRNSASNQSYTIFTGESELFSSVLEAPMNKEKLPSVALHKINPVTGDTFLLSNVNIPQTMPSPNSAACSTTFFPQQAAIDALSAASNGPRAMDIARSDQRIRTRAAEKLAKEAVAEARETYSCNLSRVSRVRDGVGTISARYKLIHATAGDLIITVGRSVPLKRIYTTDKAQVKIAIHAPAETPSSPIDTASSVLMSLDFAHDTCIVDLPALLALEAEYMLDTAVAALFATAAMEAQEPVQSHMVFDAPPQAAVKLSRKQKKDLRKNKATKTSTGIWPLRKSRVREIDEGVEEMSGTAKSALAVIELGISGAFWALEKGVRKLDERSGRREQDRAPLLNV